MQHKKQIVITGGPGGGKTSILEVIKKHFENKVDTVSEAATILYGGGFPHRLDGESMRHIQTAIYYVAKEHENLVSLTGKTNINICDRGTLDGIAYWPSTGKTFFETLNTTLEKEYSRYQLVIYLRSPRDTNNYSNGGQRIENHLLALEVDKKMEQIWSKHKNLRIVEDTKHFLSKINNVINILEIEIPKLL
jgi:thymidylate kinase